MQVSANDKIRIATVGVGAMGTGDTNMALRVGGTELVAVCDVYEGRLERAREVWGRDTFTTRDYREILARRDIDVVIVATPDHWHARITREALEAGKDVYCEKPMVHSVDEGLGIVEAQNKSGRILGVGSQYVSSMVYEKARDLLKAGAIGEVNLVEAWLDRNSALGAWQYSLPPDASEKTIDWDRFLGKAPRRPFEPLRLFRWRNYNDYGTGVAGDLFVHLISGLHFSIGALGPTRVFATGGLRYWKDGRDAPDVVLSVMEYPKTETHPAFSLVLRVNFAAGGGESFGVRFVGSEGILHTGLTEARLERTPRETEPGYTIGTFAQATQEEFLKQYRAKYPAVPPSADAIRPRREETYTPPREHNMHQAHHRAFFAAVRARKPFVEDAVFGFRAAAPALLSNDSLFQKRAFRWDPVSMRVAG